MKLQSTSDIKMFLKRIIDDPKYCVFDNPQYINNINVNAEMTAETPLEADMRIDAVHEDNNCTARNYIIPHNAISSKLIFYYNPVEDAGISNCDKSKLYLSFENIGKENIDRLILLDCIEPCDMDYNFCMHYQLCDISNKIYNFLFWRSLEGCSNCMIRKNRLPVVFANTNTHCKKVIFRSISDMDYVKAYKSAYIPFNNNMYKSTCLNTIDAFPTGYGNKSIGNYTTLVDPLVEYVTGYKCQKYKKYFSSEYDKDIDIARFTISSLEHKFQTTSVTRIVSPYQNVYDICRNSGLINGYRLHARINSETVKIINIYNRPIFFLVANCPVSYNGNKLSYSADHVLINYIQNSLNHHRFIGIV